MDDPSVDRVRKALAQASPEDISFESKAIGSHPMLSEQKTGFRPIAVNGVPVPDPGLVVYVEVQDARGIGWYVVDSSAGSSGGPRTHTVDSARAARMNPTFKTTPGSRRRDRTRGRRRRPVIDR